MLKRYTKNQKQQQQNHIVRFDIWFGVHSVKCILFYITLVRRRRRRRRTSEQIISNTEAIQCFTSQPEYTKTENIDENKNFPFHVESRNLGHFFMSVCFNAYTIQIFLVLWKWNDNNGPLTVYQEHDFSLHINFHRNLENANCMRFLMYFLHWIHQSRFQVNYLLDVQTGSNVRISIKKERILPGKEKNEWNNREKEILYRIGSSSRKSG